MKLRGRSLLVLVFAVVLTIVLVSVGFSVAACGGGSSEATNTLNVFVGEVVYIDPMLAFEYQGLQVDNALFDCLTQFDFKTSELKPDVAASWDVNAEATVFTFHLKKGTKFHNGREVVAADFKYQWERLTNPVNKANYSSLLSMVKGYEELQAGTATELSGVKAIDNYTLEVTLSYPLAEFPNVVAHPDCAPVPKEEVDKDPAAFAAMPIGNGAFKMAEPWVQGQGVKVVRFEEYTGTRPKIAGIFFKEYSDVDTAFLDFQAGTLDWTQIPNGQYKATVDQYGLADDGYTANPGKQVQNGQELGIVELVFNNEDELLKNADLRRACSLAINRQAICDIAWEGVRKPATSVIPSGLPGYEENAWQYSRYDVQAAKDMLAKAGYPNGTGLPTIKLSFISGVGQEEIMQLVQADLGVIGINCEFDANDGSTYWEKVGGGAYQIGANAWTADYPTIDNFLSPLFTSTSGMNSDRYVNKAVDDAIAAARKITDAGERMKASQAVVRLIGDDAPEAPIATYAHRNVASKRVHNLTYSPMSFLDFVGCSISQ